MKTKLDIILDNWRMEGKIAADEEAMDSLTRQVVELTAMVHEMTAEITGPPHADPFGDCPACGDHSMRDFHEAGMGRPPLTVDSLLSKIEADQLTDDMLYAHYESVTPELRRLRA